MIYVNIVSYIALIVCICICIHIISLYAYVYIYVIIYIYTVYRYRKGRSSHFPDIEPTNKGPQSIEI